MCRRCAWLKAALYLYMGEDICRFYWCGREVRFGSVSAHGRRSSSVLLVWLCSQLVAVTSLPLLYRLGQGLAPFVWLRKRVKKIGAGLKPRGNISAPLLGCPPAQLPFHVPSSSARLHPRSGAPCCLGGRRWCGRPRVRPHVRPHSAPCRPGARSRSGIVLLPLLLPSLSVLVSALLPPSTQSLP